MFRIFISFNENVSNLLLNIIIPSPNKMYPESQIKIDSQMKHLVFIAFRVHVGKRIYLKSLINML